MKIDKNKRTISDVSLITKGMSLNGAVVDDTTIEEIYQLAKDGVKVFISHAEDSANRNVGDGVGFITGLYKDGDQLKGHLQFLKAFVENRKAEYETIMELAELDPKGFGLSMSFFGPREKKGDLEYYRANIVASADLVNVPAANPNGLLSVQAERISTENNTETQVEKTESETQPEPENLNLNQTKKIMKLDKNTYDKIKAEFPDRLNEAVELSFDDSIEDVYEHIYKIVEEAKIRGVYAERDALQAKVTELSAELDAMKIKLSSMEEEKKNEIQALSLKISGYEEKLSKFGASPVNTIGGEEQKLSIVEQYDAIPNSDFQKKMQFLKLHEAEIMASRKNK